MFDWVFNTPQFAEQKIPEHFMLHASPTMKLNCNSENLQKILREYH